MFILIANVGATSFRTNEPYNIRHSVRVNGVPTSTALCNITVLDPTNIVIVSFKAMSYDSSTQTYNYTLPGSNTSKIGDYCYDITCSDPTSHENATDHFCAPATPAGMDLGIGQSIIYFILLGLSFVFLGGFIYGAVVIPFKNKRNPENQVVAINNFKYLKILFIALSYILLMWIAYLLYNISYAFIYIKMFSDIFLFLFRLLIGFMWPIIVVTIMLSIYLWAIDKKTQKKLERGLTIK